MLVLRILRDKQLLIWARDQQWHLAPTFILLSTVISQKLPKNTVYRSSLNQYLEPRERMPGQYKYPEQGFPLGFSQSPCVICIPQLKLWTCKTCLTLANYLLISSPRCRTIWRNFYVIKDSE